jgi:hypothetical protein
MCSLCCNGGIDGLASSGEYEEEGVPTSVDLDSAVAAKRFSDDPAVVSDQLCVTFAESL